jgi:hypothetical protein
MQITDCKATISKCVPRGWYQDIPSSLMPDWQRGA